MIKLIAAIDSLCGIATDSGIPWDLPSDHQYYVSKVASGKILMGYNTYLEHSSTLYDRPEYVLTSRSEPLREGFIAVSDLDTFLKQNRDTWVLGGSAIFEAALPYADKLYITQVNGIFDCTKFFPSFGEDFFLCEKGKIKKENGVEFQHQIWKSKKLATTNSYAESVDTR